MAGVVTSNLTRITAAESADDPGWIDSSGPGSAQVDDVFVQGAESRGRRVDNTTRSFAFRIASAGTVDLSASNTYVGWWFNNVQPPSIDDSGTAMEATISSSQSADTNIDRWLAFNTTVYPLIGGWQRVWVAINEVTPTNTSGTPVNTALSMFGIRNDQLDIGGTSPNVLVDAIDYLDAGVHTDGVFIFIDEGTVGDPATFADLISADEGTGANEYGVIQTRSGIIYCTARIGFATGTTATIFNDSSFVLIFPSQHTINNDTMGMTFDLTFPETNVDMADAVIKSAGLTQGDIIVTAATGDWDMIRMTLDSIRTIDLTNACSISDTAIVSSGKLNQNSATLSNITVSLAATGQSVAFIIADDLALISNSTFNFSDGHAIEITTAGTYTFTNNKFNNYGSDDTGDAAIFNSSGGQVTINVVGGGDTPTVVPLATTTVNNPKVLTIGGIESGSEARLFDLSDRTELEGDESVEGSVQLAVLVDAGTSYVATDVLTITGGNFSVVAQITVDTVGGSGEVLTFTVTQVGSYSLNPTNPVSHSGGTGSGATFNLTIKGSLVHNFGPLVPAVVAYAHIVHPDFEFLRLDDIVLDADRTLTASQRGDRNFSNP